MVKTVIETYMVIPPDGGWGWVITMVSFCCNLVADGVMYTFGIFLFEIAEDLKVEAAKVAITNSTMTAAYFLCGPLFCALTNKFGYRCVTFFGSIIAGSAHILASFTTSVYSFILVLGIIGGVGFGMMYVPSVIAIGNYFEKWRAVASSVSTTGSAVGIILFPPVFQNFLKHLHWRDKFRVLGGACCVCCLLSLLYRPLHPIKVVMEGEDTYMTTAEGHKKKVYPTAAQMLEAMELGANTSGKQGRRLSVQAEEKKWYTYECMCCHCGRSSYPPARPFYRDDIFYSPLKKLGLYRDTGGTGDKLITDYRLAVTRVVTAKELEEEQKECVCCPEAFTRALASMLNPALMKSPTFLVLCFSGYLTTLGLYTPFMFLAQRAKDKGLDAGIAYYLISVLGISNALGRFLSGFMVSIPGQSSNSMSYINLLASGLAATCSGLSMAVWYQFFAAFIVGFGLGAYISLRPIVIVDFFGIDHLSNGMGIHLVFQGAGCLMGVPFSSYLQQTTNSYDVSLYFAGIVIIVSGVILIPLSCIMNYEQKRT